MATRNRWVRRINLLYSHKCQHIDFKRPILFCSFIFSKDNEEAESERERERKRE